MDVPRHTGRGFWLVAVGGSIGAAARWGLRELLDSDFGSFPWATLVANGLGAVAIALVAGWLVRGSAIWLIAVSGAIGGFTTFSAFAVEVERLVEAERSGLALAYLLATMAIGFAAQLLARRRAGSP